MFDRIVEKGSYSEKDAADLIKQVPRQSQTSRQSLMPLTPLHVHCPGVICSGLHARSRSRPQRSEAREPSVLQVTSGYKATIYLPTANHYICQQ